MGKCGIYQIQCNRGGLYVGSSKNIYFRWKSHRQQLRNGKSPCIHLQHAWTKYGEEAFFFSVLEECYFEALRDREQYYIDLLKPNLNVMTEVLRFTPTEEMLERKRSALRARAALVTHCPVGHEYTDENTYIGKNGKRVCRRCNAIRVSKVYASETPEERERRRLRAKADHLKNRISRLAKQKEYAKLRKKEKQEYDKAHRSKWNENRRMMRLNETPEHREHRLKLKREYYRRLNCSQK